MSGCQRLYQTVAQCGRFDRPRQNRASCRIRHHLAQDLIQATAANQANGMQGAARQALEVLQCGPVSKAQTLEDAAGDLAHGLRHGLLAAHAKALDCLAHINRRPKLFRRRINK